MEPDKKDGALGFGGSKVKTLKGIRSIFEDAGILVVDKPSGLLSQPGKGPNLSDSVLTRVRAVYPWAELVHRLDRDTSGLLMLALNPEMHRAMSLAFANRRVEKNYIGLCSGQLSGLSGSIVCPLARIANQPPQYAAHPEGRIAVTLWHALATESTHTRVQLVPITGRSHQLRAHLQAIGHPLLGDPIYGKDPGERLKLHAETLGFQHPLDDLWHDLHVPAPF
ncbi:MAG: hypothetical protein RLZ25_301 [Pseudomonadota bacterium]|jgi:tRNA pseudouridine32 synthase/23S rRNA pseudouridine746 synthase